MLGLASSTGRLFQRQRRVEIDRRGGGWFGLTIDGALPEGGDQLVGDGRGGKQMQRPSGRLLPFDGKRLRRPAKTSIKQQARCGDANTLVAGLQALSERLNCCGSMLPGQLGDICARPTAWAPADAWPKTSARDTAAATALAALFVR